MDQSFESAFMRLEQILEKMNGGKTPLEESIALFEEADKLLRHCSQKLSSAEQKVETLIKTRSGETVLGDDRQPKAEPYSSLLKRRGKRLRLRWR